MTSEPSSVAKSIYENIETHREIMRANGAAPDPDTIRSIIDAALKAEREAAEGLAKAVRQYISCEAKERDYWLLQMAYKLKAMKVHKMNGKWYQVEADHLSLLPALTLPLRAGQRVICRDGEERFVISVRGEVAYWTQEKVPDSCWYTRDGVYLRVKPHDYDAIADAPVRTADAKPDEKKEQAAAAGGKAESLPTPHSVDVSAKVDIVVQIVSWPANTGA